MRKRKFMNPSTAATWQRAGTTQLTVLKYFNVLGIITCSYVFANKKDTDFVIMESLHELLRDPLYWIGAVTVAWLSLCTLCFLFNGIRVWIVGNGNLVRASNIGKWAGWYTLHWNIYRNVRNTSRQAISYCSNWHWSPLVSSFNPTDWF